jgi:molybdopterin converting factor subunit 1
MMRVRVLLFAIYRDLAGTGEIEVEVPFEATARTALDRLRSLNDRFERLPAEPAVAVNLEYSSLDAILNDGDELALLPPVAGG